MRKKIIAEISLFSIELIVVAVIFVSSLLGFILLTNYIFELRGTGFDSVVFGWVEPHVSPNNTPVMVGLSFLASQHFLLPANILLAAYYLFIVRHRWYSIRVPVVALGSFLVMWGLKVFFHRARPLYPVYEAAAGFSYPSGHAMSAMTFYGLLAFIIRDRKLVQKNWWVYVVLLALLIFLIGFSRVYLRVHYASDVIAGFLMGFVWLVLSLWITGAIEKRAGSNNQG